MEEYSCKTKLYIGCGSTKVLQQLGIQRLFVVSDPYFAKNGTAQAIADSAGAQSTQIYSQVTPDPTVTQVAQATAAMTEFAPDTVVALGGGSALDCAKAMVCFSKQQVLFVAIPTTSGSGSEVTDFAILTHNGVKHPLIDESLQPDVAILDSDLLKQLPPGLIADTGFDVLSHALEAYAATGSSLITDALAEKAFCTAFQALPRSYAGDTGMRLPMHQASSMAAMAFNRAGLGLCHAMSHAMGAVYHIPHGRLNAILLPAVVEANDAAREKYAALAAMVGLGSAGVTLGVRNLKIALIRLRKQLNLPDTLAACGVTAQQFRQTREQVITAALADPCCKTNPVPVTRALVSGVLEGVSGGR